MNKKITCLSLSVLLIFMLVACAAKDKTNSETVELVTQSSTSSHVDGTHEEMNSEKSVWSYTSDLSESKAGAAIVTVNGKLYAIGGEGQIAKGVNTVEEYNPETDTWVKKADMPTSRSLAIALVLEGKIFVIGGVSDDQALPTVEVYDPTTDQWTKGTDMPIASDFLGSGVVVNGKIYVMGIKSVFQEYSPATDTWTTKSSPEDILDFRTLATVDGKIYSFGGGIIDTCYKNLDVYDPATDTWTKKADMPEEKYEIEVATLNNEIYVFGGYNQVKNLIQDVQKYNPVTEEWTTLSMIPEGVHMPGIAVLNDKIYLVGGHSSLARFYDLRKKVLVYDPSLNH